ncbi:MAG: hypothetical protein M1321_01180 [Candidatus Marsarchaeota archaeon]|nr:hypothetical protein [Candidatus Marsarchaeota archaeon]
MPDATRQWEIDERLVLARQFYNKVLAQSIYNASWNRFINMLSYKAESAGMKVIKVLHKATTLGQRGSHAQGDTASAVQQASKSRIEELRTDKTHPLRDAVVA